MDDVDRRTNECYRASRSRFMGCCATVERELVASEGGNFSLVPGWSSPADADAGMEVVEKRNVGMVEASFPVEPVGVRRQQPRPAAPTPSTASPTSSASPVSSVASPSPPVPEVSHPSARKEPPAPAKPKAAREEAAWTQDMVPPEEPAPRAPVGSQVKPPPKQPQLGLVPAPPAPPAPPKPEREEPEASRPQSPAAKRPAAAVGDDGDVGGGGPAVAAVPAESSFAGVDQLVAPAAEAPARPPSRSRGPQSKMVKYLGKDGKGRRHSIPHKTLDDLTRHLVGCHEQDKLFPSAAQSEPAPPPPPPLPTDEILLQGAISEGCGVLRVKTGEGNDVFLTYRASTAHWLVVHSTDKKVPLGSTADYPDSTAAMMQLAELQLKRPAWEPVLSELEVAETLATAELRAGFSVDRLFQGVTAPKQLVILCGPPGSGKTTAALAKPELHYKASVRLSQDDVIRHATEHLFHKLAEGRPFARSDPFEKEAFLIESLHLYSRFSDLAMKVLWKGERNAFNEALDKGVGITVETIGASLTTLRPAVEAARAKGYKIVALFCQAPGAELRRRCEARIHKELSTGVMHGVRRFDAFLDHLADAVAEAWPDLAALCDDARIVRYLEQDHLQGHGDIVLKGQTHERCGVVQVRTPQSKQVHLVYRASTGRWVVVFSTAEDVPLGCTAGYPDSTAALVGRAELRLRRPTWKPVLTDVEINEAVDKVKKKLHVMIDNLMVGKTELKQLSILFGAPDCGKTTLARETRELHCSESVRLTQDEVVRECTIGLFQKLVAGRPKARTDPFQKEAFLVESLSLYNSFADIGSQVIWKGRGNAFSKALNRSLGVVVESTGGSLEGLKPMAAAARENGYSIIGIFPATPGGELRRRCEARFDRELEAGRMLGCRHFDAYLDLQADMAERARPELGLLCDDAHTVAGPMGPAAPRRRQLDGEEILSEDSQAPDGPEDLLVAQEETGNLTPRSLPTAGRDVVDFEMVLSDLEEVEALAYSEAFALFGSSEGDVGALDSPLLREFVLLNSCINPVDLDGELIKAAPDMKMTPARLVQLLRDHACLDAPAIQLFMEASNNGDAASAQACRRALPTLALGQEGASSLPGARRLNRERWERVLDAVMCTAGEYVDMEQWLAYWRTTARTLRLLHWANL